MSVETPWTVADPSSFPTGFVLYDERTSKQQEQHDDWVENSPCFADVNSGVALPERAIDVELQIEVLGKPMTRIWQQTGSCVGAGAGYSGGAAMVGDVAVGGDADFPEIPCFLVAYGEGRRIAGYRGRGEGSWGVAQIRAENEYGTGDVDDPRFPKPKYTADGLWLYYTEAQEIEWSYSPRWPVNRNEIESDANKLAFDRTVRGRTEEELDQALAQFYGVTIAGSYGWRTQRIKNGRLISNWDGRIAHQMSVGGYDHDSQLGKLYLIHNQWNKTAHQVCPWLSRFNCFGSFWMPADDMRKYLKMSSTELTIRAGRRGLGPRKIVAGRMGIGD